MDVARHFFLYLMCHCLLGTRTIGWPRADNLGRSGPAAEIREAREGAIMDPRQFEVLSRRVGTATTRRGALKVLAGGVAASVLALLRPMPAWRTWTFGISPRMYQSSTAGLPCRSVSNDRQCCSGICRKTVKLDPAPDPIVVPLPPPLPDAEIPLPDEVEGVCDCRPRVPAAMRS